MNIHCEGIWIPKEIWIKKDLSISDRVLLAVVHALYSDQYHGCIASNQCLADCMQMEENSVAKSLTKLRKKGLLEDVSFDGRTRIIKAIF